MNRLLGSIMLIAGTAIGAGMLSLPVATALMGFIPSLVLFSLIAWLMIYVGLLIIEVLSLLPANATMISMAQDTLGPWGKRAATVSYFFLLLMLNIAYLSGACNQILHALGLESTLAWRAGLGALLAFGSGWLAAAHTAVVDRVNRYLFAGLIATFSAIFFVIAGHISAKPLLAHDWGSIWTPLALILTSFGYHLSLPNIFDYLERDAKKTRLAIIFGTLIPLCVYLIWQFMVLGSVSYEGANGLAWAFEKGYAASIPLSHTLAQTSSGFYISPLLSLFALLAILTSFLSTMLALAEFVADAAGWPISEKTKPLMALCVAGPLLFFSLLGTRLFLDALGYAGIWSALLLGCLPILMAALARKQHGIEKRPYIVCGGYPLMAIAFTAFSLIIVIEIITHFGVF